MAPTWTRDSGGYYHHSDYPRLLVRSTNQTGHCRWEVVRFRKPANYETMARNHTLIDAKRTVEQEGDRWSQ